MTKKNLIDKESEFVVSHYKDGTLLPKEGWRRFRLTHQISSFKRYVAAASVATIVLAASASLYYYYAASHSTTEEIHLSSTQETKLADENKIEKIEFHNASLKEVVAEIERVYSVKISNVPNEDLRVTISYEGTAQDVVETINDLLNTNLLIVSKNNIKE